MQGLLTTGLELLNPIDFVVKGVSCFAKLDVKFFKSHSNLTGVDTSILLRHLLYRSGLCKFLKKKRMMEAEIGFISIVKCKTAVSRHCSLALSHRPVFCSQQRLHYHGHPIIHCTSHPELRISSGHISCSQVSIVHFKLIGPCITVTS